MGPEILLLAGSIYWDYAARMSPEQRCVCRNIILEKSRRRAFTSQGYATHLWHISYLSWLVFESCIMQHLPIQDNRLQLKISHLNTEIISACSHLSSVARSF